MENNNGLIEQEVKKEFSNDTTILCEQSQNFLSTIYPAYLLPHRQIDEMSNLIEADSAFLLDCFTYFRLVSCTLDKMQDEFAFLNQKMEKFFTAIHSLCITVAYGIVSNQGITNLILGINGKDNVNTTKAVIEGLLSGIELEKITLDFAQRTDFATSYGILSAIPTTILDAKPQKFDIAPIMKSLNGHNYTLLFIAKPSPSDIILQKMNVLVDVRDQCFAISKRSVARQFNKTVTGSHATANTDGTSTSTSETKGSNWGINAIIASYGRNKSKTESNSKTSSKSITDGISAAISEGGSIAVDIQNGLALELMNYADKAINRLKAGQSNGMWQTAITYSSDNDVTRNIVQACLCGEISKPNPDLLPVIPFTGTADKQVLLIPKQLLSKDTTSENPLCSLINSSEIGMICTPPIDNVPNFELKHGKSYPLISAGTAVKSSIEIGKVADGQRVISNMPFTLSYADLNKHTFVCGITGSGKTTTVKGILKNCDKPFMVLESAKKEYRNIALMGERRPTVYTLGKPEINCPRINPFYIMAGISPQIHIDFLKDLFNAAFSFYGPMPYILEKCLQNVYTNKGWNLTLGFHPYLVNQYNPVDFFDFDNMQKKYKLAAQKFLFPTMQELKTEIQRYIETGAGMEYEGDVAGNIKTAIKVRLESLCNGSKGFMFNTNECIDAEALFENNVVFELEGLADDADKAFCVGLLIIFISEYRQILKDAQGNQELELQHLLVIEEAHRLLKNVDTERSSEFMGNPKGKAVEHFTNMLAEMRSYGQGVIIAEQIPSKLAPDVIKNSSNKIIQRVVSADDQELVANTIGVDTEEAIYLGALKTGYALCHKEGMTQPIKVKINPVRDNYVSDEVLYNINPTQRILLINVSIVKDAVTDIIDQLAFKLLNTLLVCEWKQGVASVENVKDILADKLRAKDVHLVLCDNSSTVIAIILSEVVVKYLINGVYRTGAIITDDLYSLVEDIVRVPTEGRIIQFKNQAKQLYSMDARKYGLLVVSEMIKFQYEEGIALKESARNFFISCDDEDLFDVVSAVKDGDRL